MKIHGVNALVLVAFSSVSIAQRTPVLREALVGPPTVAPGDTVASQARFRLAPIPGVTTGWHAVPEQMTVPAASLVRLELALPMPHTVSWTGAVETKSADGVSSADVIEDGTGRTSVKAEIFDRKGRLRHQVGVDILFAPIGSEALRVSEVTATQWLWDEASDSFQEFETQEGLRSDQSLSLPVGVRTTLTAWTEALTASPALEWSLDGNPVALGDMLELHFEEPGEHTVAVGTPVQFKSFRISATGTGGTLAFTPWPNICFRRCSLSATSQYLGAGTYRITVILNNDGNCKTTFDLYGHGTAPSGYAWNPGPSFVIPLYGQTSTMLSFDVTLVDTQPLPDNLCGAATFSVIARRHGRVRPRCSQLVLSLAVGDGCPAE